MEGYRSTRSSAKDQGPSSQKHSNYSQRGPPAADHSSLGGASRASKAASPKESGTDSSGKTSKGSTSKSGRTSSSSLSSSSKNTPSSPHSSSKGVSTLKQTSSIGSSKTPSSPENPLRQSSASASSHAKASSSGPGVRGSKSHVREREPAKSKSDAKEHGNEMTVKNPELVHNDKAVDNNDLINGLALQRLWDEKPDIDHLSHSLMNLYYTLNEARLSSLSPADLKLSELSPKKHPQESGRLKEEGKSKSGKPKDEGNGEMDVEEAGSDKDETKRQEELRELRERIFLSALRVRSRALSHLSLTHSRMRKLVKFARHLNVKCNTLNLNAERIERFYLKKCRHHQRVRSLNEVYEKLSRVVGKLPNLSQLQAHSADLVEKRLKTVEKTAKVKEQIERQKSHIQRITQLMAGIGEPGAE